MNRELRNSGVMNFGGTMNVSGAVGDGATVNIDAAPRERSGRTKNTSSRTIGVVTILATEMQAVRRAFGLDTQKYGDRIFYTGQAATASGPVRIVAARTLQKGQQSVASTVSELQRRFSPETFVLVGIAGAVHRDPSIGDVVVATSVISYDPRKIVPGHVYHRGRELRPPAVSVHAMNAFFTDYGEPAVVDDFRVFSGPVGSGEAVIADAESIIRKYLEAYNDQVLAVEMEASGFAQFCHEVDTEIGTPSWAVVRGISDRGDVAKSDDAHQRAADNAARVLWLAAPYLADAQVSDTQGA